MDRSSSYGRELDFAIWNWRLRVWESPETLLTQEIYEFDNPEDYLGPSNVVDIRVLLDRNTNNLAASARIRGITLRQTGSFD